jgi:hypothetical protein
MQDVFTMQWTNLLEALSLGRERWIECAIGTMAAMSRQTVEVFDET